MFNYQPILQQIHAAVEPLLGEGKVASYIPELAKVPIRQFGMAVVDLEGQVYATGDAATRFSIQSISKLFALVLAFQRERDALWRRVGREPSGNPFNSLVQLERENGVPRNPFINAGALVVTDVLQDHYPDATQAVLDCVRELSGAPEVTVNERVAQSELATSSRNMAMAYFMKSFGNLRHDAAAVVEAYCKHCAIEMNCVELAQAVLFLANHGVDPDIAAPIVDTSTAKRLNALMLTCGTYDAAGDFAYRVGLPAKSGVGGGIVAVLPGRCGICVWSPGLEESGNSYAGSIALEMFTTLTRQSVF